MLPKISSALQKLAKPVTSASPQAGVGDQDQHRQPKKDDFKRFRPKPELKVVPPTETTAEKPPQTPLPVAGPPAPSLPHHQPGGVGSVLLQLLQQLQRQRESVLKWLGSATYRSTVGRSRNEKSKKGVMYDRKG